MSGKKMSDNTAPAAISRPMVRSQILVYSHACLIDPLTRNPARGTMPKKITDRPASFK